MNKQLENIKKYAFYMENKTVLDITENTEEYDTKNSEFWFKQYIQIESNLINICNQYKINTDEMLKREHSGFNFIKSMISALEQ